MKKATRSISLGGRMGSAVLAKLSHKARIRPEKSTEVSNQSEKRQTLA